MTVNLKYLHGCLPAGMRRLSFRHTWRQVPGQGGVAGQLVIGFPAGLGGI